MNLPLRHDASGAFSGPFSEYNSDLYARLRFWRFVRWRTKQMGLGWHSLSSNTRG